jgi:PhnB protein
MAIISYISFNGNCREAVEFYAKAFSAEAPRITTFGDNPPNPAYPLSEQAKKLVLHAELKIAGGILMFSDTFPGNPFIAGNNISLTVMGNNIDDIKTFFNNLKEGGAVTMELQETFWSKCYGMLTDKFGIGWQFSLEGH